MLKSKFPYKHAWADNFSCRRDEYRIFNVASDCGVRRSHLVFDKYGSQVARPFTKVAFPCLYGSFRGIASIYVGRDRSKVDSVISERLFQEFK